MDVYARKEEVDILEAAVKLVRFLLKNLVWVLLFPTLGLLGAYFLTLKQAVRYESKLVLRATMVSEEEMGFLLQNYSRAGIPGASGNGVNGQLIDFDYTVYSKENSLFTVITSVATDTSMLRKIHEAIPKQLDQEDIIEEYLDANRTYTREIRDEYNEKIQMLEGVLQNKKENALSDVPELLNLYAKVGELNLRLNQKSLIKVVSRFKPVELGSAKTWTLSKGLISGLLVAAAFLAIKSFIIYYRKSVSKTP